MKTRESLLAGLPADLVAAMTALDKDSDARGREIIDRRKSKDLLWRVYMPNRTPPESPRYILASTAAKACRLVSAETGEPINELTAENCETFRGSLRQKP